MFQRPNLREFVHARLGGYKYMTLRAHAQHLGRQNDLPNSIAFARVNLQDRDVSDRQSVMRAIQRARLALQAA